MTNKTKSDTKSRRRTAKLAGCILSILAMFAPGPATAQFENADIRVMEIFKAAYQGICTSIEGDSGDALQPEIWDLEFSYDYEPDETRPFRLYRIHCYNGAYNEIHIFYGADEYEEVKQITFARPDFTVHYKDDDYLSTQYKIEMHGFSASDMMVNSGFNPETDTIYEFSRWRGFGDASSAGEWEFQRGKFVLQSYDVDPTYDGEYHQDRIYGEGDPNNDY